MLFSDKFISAGTQLNTYKNHVAAPILRRTFTLHATHGVTLCVCGLGFYRLFVNGRDVTCGMLAPYIVNPDQVMFYDSYELSEYLTEGENCIALLLGNGMQNAEGGLVWDFDKAAFRSAPKVALSVEQNGELLFEADSSFRTMPSHILYDDMRAGEWVDLRLMDTSWSRVGFDDSRMTAAIAVDTPHGDRLLRRAHNILPQYELSPISITRSLGGYLYDFGENLAGVCRVCIRGKAGQIVDLTHSEIALHNRAFMRNISFGKRTKHGYNQRMRLILSGGDDTYTPVFSYYGFRYVFVRGITAAQATKDLLTYVVCNSALPKVGDFTCSDNTINRLYKMAEESTLANYYYFPTDCPHREKNGWTGDAALSCEQTMMNYDATDSYRDWIAAITRAMREDGALPGIIPTGGWGFVWGNGPSWDTALFTIPTLVYRYSGDREILAIAAPSMTRYLQYVAKNLRPDGMVCLGLGDWLEVDKMTHGFSTPEEVTDTLQCIHMCDMALSTYEVLGTEEHTADTQELMASLIAAFRAKYIRDGVITLDAQTIYAMAIRTNGVLTQSEKDTAFASLVAHIVRSNYTMHCGIVGFKPLFEALFEYDRADIAYTLMSSREYGCIGHWVAQELSVLPESFFKTKRPYGSFTRHDARSVNSLNHHCWSSFVTWLFAGFCGININPTGDDVTHVVISPRFTRKLTSASAYRMLAGGKLSVDMTLDTTHAHVTVCVPQGITAEYVFPDGTVKPLAEGANSLDIELK